MELRERATPIGCVSYLPTSCSNLSIADGHCEVGYWIARPYWGQGIGSEALSKVVDYCFNVKGFSVLWGTYFPDNPASGRVMEKCGFRHTGQETTCPSLSVGADRPVLIMRLCREEYSVNGSMNTVLKNIK